MALVQKSCGKRLSGRPGTENADLQRLSHDLLLPPVRMRAEVGEAVVEVIGRVTPSGGTISSRIRSALGGFDLHHDPAPGFSSVAPSSPASRPSPPGGPSQLASLDPSSGRRGLTQHREQEGEWVGGVWSGVERSGQLAVSTPISLILLRNSLSSNASSNTIEACNSGTQ